MQVEVNKTTETLGHVLRETYRLYRRTHLAHFNVRGPNFPQLHAMFEEHYTEMWAALDTIAERVRATGGDVLPEWFYSEVGTLEKDAGTIVKGLAADHRAISTHLNQLEEIAGDAGDTATEGLATDRRTAHEQFAWMLEATAEGL